MSNLALKNVENLDETERQKYRDWLQECNKFLKSERVNPDVPRKLYVVNFETGEAEEVLEY